MTVHQTSSSNNVRSCTCPSYHAGTLLAAFLVVCIVERLQYRSSTDHLILFSGIGSDLLVKKLNMSRFWCLFISAVVFTATQFAGAMISNPNTLVIVSGLTGIAYGFLFGVVPSLVAHTFGIGGLSQNWGFMILAPVLSGNVFNLLYGSIFDKHSVVGPDGERDCPDGLGCTKLPITRRSSPVLPESQCVSGVLCARSRFIALKRNWSMIVLPKSIHIRFQYPFLIHLGLG